MAVTNQRYHAVVMGDLVRSERATSIEQLHARFNDAISEANQHHATNLASPLTITLGDEFQGLATSLVATLPLIRDLRFALMSDAVDCRFAIGVAALRTPINPDKAWNMMGPGLSRTRDRLNEKRAGSLYRFVVTEDRAIETALEALGAGLTSIERRWTDQQRRDIVALLAGATPGDVARQRNVSVHTIYKVRNSGDFDTYGLHWQAIEAILAQIDSQTGMG
jgi:SatD family (SatD)